MGEIMTKYVFVTGGVVSGLGKGITAASLGRLLKDRGYKVFMQKFDPYLNIDPGTLNPVEHGEVFVTEDGLETDLDLGHYERFIDEYLTSESNITTGKVYDAILTKERRGDYGGKTVQVIPHVTNEIKSRFHVSEDKDEVVIIEIGGTVGDIESSPFLESIRQFRYDVGVENTCLIHVCLVPFLRASLEVKTKPVQQSVKSLQALGLWPDIIVCRTEIPLEDKTKEKIGLFCNVKPKNVLNNTDVEYLYEAPMMLEKEGLADAVVETLHLENNTPDHSDWLRMLERLRNSKGYVKVALVGKYVALHDAYLSVVEALSHAGIENDIKVKIKWVDSERLEKEKAEDIFADVSGIIVPGGFGNRGIEGKIEAIRYARENNIPFLGLCLGMQLSLVEFARHVLGYADANSKEFDEHTACPIIHLLDGQHEITDIGGTLRLGAYRCILKDGSLAHDLYGEHEIIERHRHRYEVNNEYREELESHGMSLSGLSPDGIIVEMAEIPSHRFFIATQAHPEFKSRPNRAHPLFKGFVKASKEYSKEHETN